MPLKVLMAQGFPFMQPILCSFVQSDWLNPVNNFVDLRHQIGRKG
ncbi:hypothetical protein [Coleofasciculus sp. G3-WIS-01]